MLLEIDVLKQIHLIFENSLLKSYDNYSQNLPNKNIKVWKH